MTEIIMLPISKLKLLEANPRKIDRNQMAKLEQSIERDPEFLERRPILVNMRENGYHVYAGNQRVRAAKRLKMKQIPCIIDVDLNDEVMQKRIILDNVSFGEFDYDMLACSFDPAELLELGFTENQLHIDVSDTTLDSEAAGSESDKPICPECGQKLKSKKNAR